MILRRLKNLWKLSEYEPAEVKKVAIGDRVDGLIKIDKIKQQRLATIIDMQPPVDFDENLNEND